MVSRGGLALTESRGVLALDRLVMAYFALTGFVAAILGGPAGIAIGVAHAVAAFGVSRLAAWQPRSGLPGFLRASYGVLISPALYAELAILNRLATDRFFDRMVQGWDAAVFGGQPSMTLSAAVPWVPLSETLHFGYFVYYAIVPAALIGVYKTRGFDALHRTSVAVAAAFFTSYLIFMMFPVAGPRYEFERIGGEISDGRVYGLVHTILEGGSSKGTAFPSSHIAASLAAVLAAGREDVRWFWLLIVPETALMIGTVYGRFHYGVDALAGLALAVGVWAATARLEGAPGTGQPVA